MKLVALCVLVALAVHTEALAQLRTRGGASVAAAVPIVPAANEAAGETVGEDGQKVEMVMAEIKSEADSILEDGSNDSSASEDGEEPIHVHYQKFTKPMQLLPNDHTTLVEVEAAVRDDDEGGSDKGSNPTYILPVDPFNYFPFFNGFSNVNPFSQFYPPAPYLYPQYTNYMHQYASHGAGHPPGYPYPGAYGGVGHSYGWGGHGHGGLYGGGAHGGFPYNYPHPSPHMHYPFGAYKMDVSGPDVRTGSNNPPPFPQFTETSATAHLITPEIIPKEKFEQEEAEAASEEESDASLLELGSQEEEESDEADVEYESEEGSSEAQDLEYESEEGSEEAQDVEILDESDENEMSGEVEYEAETGNEEATDLEYTP
jgi:hypothetical protein